MATFTRALKKAHQVLYLKASSTILRSKLMPLLPSALIGLENLQSQLTNHNQNHHACFFSFRCSSTSTNPHIDLSNEDSKRHLFNRSVLALFCLLSFTSLSLSFSQLLALFFLLTSFFLCFFFGCWT